MVLFVGVPAVRGLRFLMNKKSWQIFQLGDVPHEGYFSREINLKNLTLGRTIFSRTLQAVKNLTPFSAYDELKLPEHVFWLHEVPACYKNFLKNISQTKIFTCLKKSRKSPSDRHSGHPWDSRPIAHPWAQLVNFQSGLARNKKKPYNNGSY